MLHASDWPHTFFIPGVFMFSIVHTCASVYVCSVCVHTCVCVHVRVCMHPYKHQIFVSIIKPLGQIYDIIGDR